MATAAAPGIVDAHLHIWQRSRFAYSWIEAGSMMDRDFGLDDVRAEMQALNVCGGILIEATNTAEEIAWLLETSEAHPLGWGVVGWLNLESDDIEAQIDHFARHPHFKGVRLNWLESRPQAYRLNAAMQAIATNQLVVDLLTCRSYLPDIAHFIAAYPKITFVLNHLGGVQISNGDLEDWKAVIELFTALPNVRIKISGYTASINTSPTVTTLRDYLQVAATGLGIERLMFGSNYPLCLNTTSYTETVTRLQQAAAGMTFWERDQVFRETALRTYRLRVTA